MKILSSSLLLCSVLAAPAALAAEAQQLDPVFVTTTRSDQPQNRLPAATTVITREDIVASGARNVADALRLAPGVQVRDLFGDGSQNASVDMRGFGAAANANTLILVDGRRLNNPDIAAPDLSSISLKDVERIEIINGSAGSLYGDQAVGGVINIITRQPAGLSGHIAGGAGSYDEMHGSASIGQRVGGFFYRLSGEGKGTDNYRDNNRHENENVTGRVGYDYGDGSAYYEMGYVKDRMQLAGGLTAAQVQQNRQQCQPGSCNAYSDGTTAFQRINWDQSLSEASTLEIDLTHRRGNVNGLLSGMNVTQDRDIWSFNPRVSARLGAPGRQTLLTTGIDVLSTEYQLVSPFGTQIANQRTREFYAQAIVPVAQELEATFGGRLASSDHKLFDGFNFATMTTLHDTRTAWEAGLAWKPSSDLRLYTRIDGNYRFAKADEFFNPFAPPPPGQTSLKSQTGRTYEIGSDWKLETLQLHAAAFRLDLKNEISFGTGPFGFPVNANLDDTRRQGVLLSADWQALQLLKLSAGAQYIDAKFTSGSFSGNRVPLVARQTGRVAATVKLPLDLSGNLEVQASGRRPVDTDFTSAFAPLPGHAVANLALTGQWGHWNATAKVNNLLDHEYSEYAALNFTPEPAYYPSPERNFWLNLGYSF